MQFIRRRPAWLAGHEHAAYTQAARRYLSQVNPSITDQSISPSCSFYAVHRDRFRTSRHGLGESPALLSIAFHPHPHPSPSFHPSSPLLPLQESVLPPREYRIRRAGSEAERGRYMSPSDFHRLGDLGEQEPGHVAVRPPTHSDLKSCMNHYIKCESARIINLNSIRAENTNLKILFK